MKTLTLTANKEGAFEMPMDDILEEFKKSAAAVPAVQDSQGQVDLEASGIGGFVQKLVDFKPANLPVGAAVAGGTSAYLLTKIGDYLLVKTADKTTGKPVMPLWAVDVALAFGALQLGKRVAAVRPAANYAAIFLLYEAVRDPIERQVDKLIKGPVRELPGSPTEQAMEQALRQPRRGGYYDRAFGG